MVIRPEQLPSWFCKTLVPIEFFCQLFSNLVHNLITNSLNRLKETISLKSQLSNMDSSLFLPGRYPMWKYKSEWSELADLILVRSSKDTYVNNLIQLGERAQLGYVERRGTHLVQYSLISTDLNTNIVVACTN